ncbi:NACHT domain-containing protein [Alternaria rosae]|uniref:NACHT domain-containing protein n=1 Tax=Alternaria rosae TaxID=1187941 RepID=UPI001E8CF802|nr:NACHT domain-containing protein [Alternaria rosae]KAH6865385.1 NACHT domain-containing protein [Alternaria rosae]
MAMRFSNIIKLFHRKQRETLGLRQPPVVVPTIDESQQAQSKEGPKSPDTSSPEPVAPSLPGRLWNHAYDELKAKDSRLIGHYEIILSSQMDGSYNKAVDLNCQINKISLGQSRSLQMRQLVDSGLQRTEKEATTKDSVAQGLQVFNVIKDTISTATKASPEASVAWVPICLALDILMNPLTQASSNREGIAYVVSRMDWYWHLADLFLENNQKAQRSRPLQEQLERSLIDLYASLLEYQIKSIITYHRRRELTAIKQMEEIIRQDAAQFTTHEVCDQLQVIAKDAKAQSISLHTIATSIQAQAARSVEDTKTAADNQCLQNLFLTNPSDDRERLEYLKGGLLDGSFRWILDNAAYQQWCDDPEVRLLWIEGAPGQGKTMLMCGIIGVLGRTVLAVDLLSYFFCQTSEPHNNNANAVLRGLIHYLVGQRLSLIRHVRLEYDRVGEDLFTGSNSWTALSRIFTNMLLDPCLHEATIYILVDAIDECIDPDDRKKLLELIVRISTGVSNIKWIISSREWNDIHDILTEHPQMISHVLDPKSGVTLEAVNTYILHKVEHLARKKRYNPTDAAVIQDYLIENAGGTFLWVALVCKKLEDSTGIFYEAAMQAFPPGLKELYGRMLQQIEDLNEPEAKLYKFVLSVVVVVFQPLSYLELRNLLRELDHITDEQVEMRVKEIVCACGSFLSFDDSKVVLVHQSAKDYLKSDAYNTIFPHGHAFAYSLILARSMRILDLAYRNPDDALEPDEPAISRSATLLEVDYFVSYWPHHFTNGDFECLVYLASDKGPICPFLRKYSRRWIQSLGVGIGNLFLSSIELSVREFSQFTELCSTINDILEREEYPRGGVKFKIAGSKAVQGLTS